jgi:hypothetical protein
MYFTVISLQIALSTRNPGIFYQKIIEIFVTVNGEGHFLPEGPGGGKGEPGVPPNRIAHTYFAPPNSRSVFRRVL